MIPKTQMMSCILFDREAGFSYDSNFVPDINPDALFRSSENLITGELVGYSPRVILVDDNFNGDKIVIPKSYDTVENLDEHSVKFEVENALNSDLTNQSNPFLDDVRKNTFGSDFSKSKCIYKSHYNLENVAHWSEFMQINLHRKSKILIGKELSNLANYYHYGIMQTKLEALWDQIEDSIRFFAEECHNFQGFQIVGEGNTSYAGMVNTALSHLKDEYGKKCTLFVPTYNYPENITDTIVSTSLYNTICGLANAQEFADLIVPMSLSKNLCPVSNQYRSRRFKDIKYKEFDKYQESAVLAAGLEFLTLPYRLRSELTDVNMSDYCLINVLNRCVVTAGLKMPFPILRNQNFTQFLDKWNTQFFDSLSPFSDLEMDNKWSHILYLSSKGITQRYRHDTITSSNDKECMDLLNAFLNTFYPIKCIRNFNSKCLFRLPSTFPNVLNNKYNLTNPERNNYGRISEFYGIGCLINSRDIEQNLNNLYRRGKNDVGKLQIYDDSVKFEYKTTLERLLNLASNYSESYLL
uniref:Tubulin_3 domain-containing protein n=1 Tax=Rhodnius prolixus TaxID=13249 RepID=T1HF41_RHOPR